MLQKTKASVAKRGLVVEKESELKACAQGDGGLLPSISDKVSDEVILVFYYTHC